MSDTQLEKDRSFRFGVGFSFDPWSFTTDGNFPRLAAWIEVGSALSAYPRRLGFSLLFSLRPLKIGWNGRWVK